MLSAPLQQGKAATATPIEDEQIRTAITHKRFRQAEVMLERRRLSGTTGPRQWLLEADLFMATSKFAEALPLYQSILAEAPHHASAATSAGIACLALGRTTEASSFLAIATSLPEAGWMAWNAMAVLWDKKAAWQRSNEAYERALRLAPSTATVWNNRGYSLLLQGRFEKAQEALAEAARIDPSNSVIQRNLLLAKSMSGRYPERQQNEDQKSWAARLNNAGYAAILSGKAEDAEALLSQAIEASEVFYPKASSNLKLLKAGMRDFREDRLLFQSTSASENGERNAH
jgi:Flp pilus assembly protein TadD